MKRSNPVRPTIKDVAREAGVSICSVSYILNNNPAAKRITQATKGRVWAAVEKLGYKPSLLGAALQRGYTNQVILLIVSWNLATSHAATAMAISRAAALRGLALTVHVADDDASAEEFVRRSALLHHSGGILVLWDSPAFEKSHLLNLPAEGVPVIDLLPGKADGISVVTADREDAGYRGTRHLISLGHRSIGFIGDTELRPQTTLRKFAGYRRALEEAGLPFRSDCVENVTEFGFEGGQTGYRSLAERCPGVTALFCINDAIALGAIDAAFERGLQCPRDISVVGFGDAPEGRHWRPKLTTFALSSRRVAAQAVELVLRQRETGSMDAKAFLIPEQLIERESTGPTTAKASEPGIASPLAKDNLQAHSGGRPPGPPGS